MKEVKREEEVKKEEPEEKKDKTLQKLVHQAVLKVSKSRDEIA